MYISVYMLKEGAFAACQSSSYAIIIQSIRNGLLGHQDSKRRVAWKTLKSRASDYQSFTSYRLGRLQQFYVSLFEKRKMTFSSVWWSCLHATIYVVVSSTKAIVATVGFSLLAHEIFSLSRKKTKTSVVGHQLSQATPPMASYLAVFGRATLQFSH